MKETLDEKQEEVTATKKKLTSSRKRLANTEEWLKNLTSVLGVNLSSVDRKSVV